MVSVNEAIGGDEGFAVHDHFAFQTETNSFYCRSLS